MPSDVDSDKTCLSEKKSFSEVRESSVRSRCCAVENLSLQELKSSLKSERVARRRAVTSLDVDRDSNKICPYKKKSLSEVRDSSVTSRCVPSLSDVLPTLQKRHGVEGVGGARRCACVQSARAGSRQKKITDICIFLFWSANAAARSISTDGRQLPRAHPVVRGVCGRIRRRRARRGEETGGGVR